MFRDRIVRGYGSSHVAIVADNERNERNREAWLPKLASMHASRGLRIMPDRPAHKTPQFFRLNDRIILFKDTSHVLFVGGTNDYPSMIRYGYNQTLIRALPNAERRWVNNIPTFEKVNFRYPAQKLLTKKSERYLTRKLNIYLQQLAYLFGSSSATTVYHSSLLERIHTDFQLPMYFTIINSLLSIMLKSVVILNAHGTPIKFKFINVSSHFYKADDPTRLFIKNERRQREMTHRTYNAYRAVYETLHAEILKDVYM